MLLLTSLCSSCTIVSKCFKSSRDVEVQTKTESPTSDGDVKVQTDNPQAPAPDNTTLPDDTGQTTDANPEAPAPDNTTSDGDAEIQTETNPEAPAPSNATSPLAENEDIKPIFKGFSFSGLETMLEPEPSSSTELPAVDIEEIFKSFSFSSLETMLKNDQSKSNKGDGRDSKFKNAQANMDALGRAHRELVFNLKNLAFNLRDLGWHYYSYMTTNNYEIAAKYFGQVLVLYTILYGERPHENLVKSLQDLGMVYLDLKDQNYKSYYQQAKEMEDALPQATHGHTLFAGDMRFSISQAEEDRVSSETDDTDVIGGKAPQNSARSDIMERFKQDKGRCQQGPNTAPAPSQATPNGVLFAGPLPFSTGEVRESSGTDVGTQTGEGRESSGIDVATQTEEVHGPSANTAALVEQIRERMKEAP